MLAWAGIAATKAPKASTLLRRTRFMAFSPSSLGGGVPAKVADAKRMPQPKVERS
jgi:hypothetical protein